MWIFVQSIQKEDDGSHDTPWTVCMQLQLRITVASLRLVDDTHAAVLTTSMHALEVDLLVSKGACVMRLQGSYSDCDHKAGNLGS